LPVEQVPGDAVMLPRQVVNQMLAHAQRSPDQEVCGLIAAHDGVPLRCYPVANASHTPARRFTMDPAAQIDAMRRMRERGETLFGIYHSHPSTSALPSELDLDEAEYPEALYLIISLGTEGVLEMRGFRVKNGAAVPCDLEME